MVGQTPVPCEDLLEWGRWLATAANRRVRLTRVGPYFVSTIFLGLDHSFGAGPPLLFETMVWVDDPHEIEIQANPERGTEARTLKMDRSFLDEQKRCSTWLQAEAQHPRWSRSFDSRATTWRRSGLMVLPSLPLSRRT